jgi:2-methylcitrate dehydratase PrpD
VAVAEEVSATGAELITAIIVGYEVMLRVSMAVSPHLLTRGHHPPPAVGPFGATAAAAKLYGLPAAQILDAMGIAGSYAAGLTEYTRTGGTVKRIHCAIPAQVGVRAANLARHGLTGPPTVLEGERGFCEVFAGAFDPSVLSAGLGHDFLIMDTAIKCYSCCHLIQPALDVVGALRDRHRLTLESIAAITVYTPNMWVAENLGVVVEPHDLLGVQFSMSYCIALILSGCGCTLWELYEADLTAPLLLDVSRRVRIVPDSVSETFTSALRVEIRTNDGRIFSGATSHAKGEPENPLDADEVAAKFTALTVPVLGRERSAAACEFILGQWDAGVASLTELGV